jgi:hypothetical protein
MEGEARGERWWKRRDRKRREQRGIDPERFFANDYPRAVSKSLREYSTLEGRVAIAVRGHGEWTLALGDVEQPVLPIPDREARTRICFAPTAFAEFLGGTLDVKAAMRAGNLTVRGDVHLIAAIARILSPPRSILATRAEPW